MTSEEEASYDPTRRVVALAEAASRVDIDPSIAPKRYFRSGLEIIKMARVYLDERDYETAYILYMKYSILFVDKLPHHPNYRLATKDDLDLRRKNLKEAIQVAETLKPVLIKKYEQERQEWMKRQKIENEKREKEQAALNEKQRNEDERRRCEEEEHFRKLQAMKQQQLLEPKPVLPPPYLPSPQSQPVQSPMVHPVPPVSAPSAPLPTSHPAAFAPFTPSATVKPSPPKVEPSVPDRSLKPADVGSLVGRLRPMLLPEDLCSRFLQIADSQTRKNVETCGILCGVPEQGRYRVTHLLIPKQSGTSDTCTTSQEEDLFAVMDEQELITLGWIHTHPSQTAFLSSVDLHTHASYQALLPEAVAVVVAPKHGEKGYFRLSEPGLDSILRCRQTGFHPHEGATLFIQCQHINLAANYSIQVVDLRS